MNLVRVQASALASDPRLAPYANMRDAELAQRADPLDPVAHGGVFIAEGDLVVRRLIASRFACQSMLLAENRVEALQTDLARLPAQTPIFVAEPSVLSAIVGFNMHRGVLAIGVRGSGLTTADLLARTGPIVVLEDLVNHDNLGGVFRNAAALGGPGVSVLLSPRCADPLYRKSLRVSMGAVLSVPFARSASWPGDLSNLAHSGIQTWALVPAMGAEPINQIAQNTKAERVALVLGSEGPGLTPEAIAACQCRVTIPMAKADTMIDSLNVAMAAGIALHEVARP
ncbi:MAG: RNA methyltransferase [Phycisphaerales bacterium]|nr:RNA methyltransferase [Phycisphaerales bacterium]